jgi:uncharacterized membrane protein YoaK (UPF0700 family)
MTGNTVLLAIGLTGGDFAASARSAVALGGFVLGAALVGAVRGERSSEWVVTKALSVELAALASIATWWLLAGAHPASATRYPLIALFGLAMGLQGATVTGLDVGVSTTFITGTWTAVSSTFGRRLGLRARGATSGREEPHERPTQVAVLACYLGAALAAGGLWYGMGTVAVVFPGALLALVVASRFRPGAADAPRPKRIARRIADSGWGDRGARVGLAARGVVYLLLAYLVGQIAAGALGTPAESGPISGQGVAQALAARSGTGRAALFALAIGLLLYALFSVLDTMLHHDDESPTAKRWADRALSAWGVVVYGAFSVYCFITALSRSGGKEHAAKTDRQDAHWSAQVLRWPAGAVWLGLLGVVLLVIAGFLVSRAARRSYQTRLRREIMSRRSWLLGLWLGGVGYLGRAMLFAVVGWFVVHAAVQDDPRQGQGVDGSIRMLAAQPVGHAVLWPLTVALGCYGCYMFVEARYRTV